MVGGEGGMLFSPLSQVLISLVMLLVGKAMAVHQDRKNKPVVNGFVVRLIVAWEHCPATNWD